MPSSIYGSFLWHQSNELILITYHVMCSSRVENPCTALVMVASVAYEEGAPESLSLLSRSSLLTAGAIDCNVPRLPAFVTLSQLVRICRIMSASVVAFLV